VIKRRPTVAARESPAPETDCRHSIRRARSPQRRARRIAQPGQESRFPLGGVRLSAVSRRARAGRQAPRPCRRLRS
jgi:hypothetical protein